MDNEEYINTLERENHKYRKLLALNRERNLIYKKLVIETLNYLYEVEKLFHDKTLREDKFKEQ